MKTRLTGILFVLLALVLSGSPAAAEGVTWRIYDVVVDIRDDGSIHVTETVEIDFNGSFSEGHRSIPMDRIESIDNVQVAVGDGANAATPSEQMSRDDYSGNPGTYTVYNEDGRTVIDYGFAPVNGLETRAVVIEYDALGVIRDYPENDPPRQEIRWTAISDEVTAVGPVRSASATINFPESVEGSEATRFDPQETSAHPTGVTWERTGMGEGDQLQVLASFPTMTDATAPAWQADADKYEGRQNLVPGMSMIVGLVTVVGAVLMGLFMWREGVREPATGAIIDILPEPPGDLPAGHVGALIDESFSSNDLLAMMIDLERRGTIEITEDASRKESDPSRYKLRLLERPGDAPAWQRPMLEGLFGDGAPVGATTTFERLKKLAASHRGKIGSAVEKDLYERGYYEEPPSESRKRWGLRIVGAAFLVALVVGAIALWSRSFGGWLIAVAVVIGVCAILLGILVTQAARKSQAGAEEAAKWKAFQRYLKQMQKEMEPDQRLQLMDTYLPWTIALGFGKSEWKEWERDDRDYRWGTHQYRPWDSRYRHHHSGMESRSGGGGSFDVQSMSNRAMGGVGTANLSMMAMLNAASDTISAGSGSSSGSGSGSASSGSSGGGGHSFS